ncbi:MAG: hypothetical protein U1A73_25640 [Pseudomonas sp.]|nr:hypothetical protein [Pseudomonas sp.]
MESHQSEYFHLPHRVLVSACFVALFGAVIYFALRSQAYEHVWLALFNLGLSLVVVWLLGVLSVSDKTVVIYRVYQVKWEDVTGARKIRVMGLPHVLINRRNGNSWWLPLYFRGARGLEQSIVRRAPEGNPIREAFSDR